MRKKRAGQFNGRGGRRAMSKKRAQVLNDLVSGQSADQPVKELAVSEQEHGGYAEYRISRSKVGTLVHIDFYKFNETLVFSCELIDKRHKA